MTAQTLYSKLDLEGAREDVADTERSESAAREALNAARAAGAPAAEISALEEVWRRADRAETAAMMEMFDIESDLDPDFYDE